MPMEMDMGQELPAIEGYMSFAGYRTWYRVTGESEEPGKFPLLCLHGGPGATWHHMEPYQELAADGRRVICYDQLGCGNSAIAEPHEKSMWTVELFIAEVAAIRKELGLDRCHVLGHSWGGMLGMAYATTRPSGLVSLVAESSPAKVSFWLTELDRLRVDLPPGVDEVLRRHEAAGTTDSEEYETTMVAFYDRHVCRLRPYPDWLDRCFARLGENPEVYHTMNGPSEFHVIGPLKDFDITADLGAIEAPTLLFCGEFDEVTPATVAVAHDLIGGSQFVVLPGCSHISQAERPDLALGLVRGWLAGVEASLAGNGHNRGA
jgi:L-proline amide hydrolase